MDQDKLGKLIPIEPEIELDGGYAYCPKCYQTDLEPIAIITICPKCGQLIRWDWMDKFKD